MTCPRPHSRSVTGLGFVLDPLPLRAHPYYSHPAAKSLPFLGIEIAVYPIFYEQVPREAFRMCVEQARGFKTTAVLGSLVLASHPPAWL